MPQPRSSGSSQIAVLDGESLLMYNGASSQRAAGDADTSLARQAWHETAILAGRRVAGWRDAAVCMGPGRASRRPGPWRASRAVGAPSPQGTSAGGLPADRGTGGRVGASGVAVAGGDSAAPGRSPTQGRASRTAGPGAGTSRGGFTCHGRAQLADSGPAVGLALPRDARRPARGPGRPVQLERCCAGPDQRGAGEAGASRRRQRPLCRL